MKTSKLCLIIIGVGLVLTLLLSIFLVLEFRVAPVGPGFLGFLAGLIGTSWLVILSIRHITEKRTAISVLPLITAIITIGILWTLPVIILASYQDYFFKANFQSYQEAANMALAGEFNDGESGDSVLTVKYRFLSQEGEISIRRSENDVNIFFYIHRGLGEFRAWVYSPTGKILGCDPRWTVVTKLKKDWYEVWVY